MLGGGGECYLLRMLLVYNKISDILRFCRSFFKA